MSFKALGFSTNDPWLKGVPCILPFFYDLYLLQLLGSPVRIVFFS